MSIPADQAQAQPLQQRPAAALQRQPQDMCSQGLRQVAPTDVCRLGRLHLLPGAGTLLAGVDHDHEAALADAGPPGLTRADERCDASQSLC